MRTIIETKNLSYCYGNEGLALRNVNIAIADGKVTAILGGNGAGKSTLFLNLNGVLTPTSGEVYFNGQLVKYNAKNIKELRKRVGIVFQDPNDQLFSGDVLSDIAFGPLNLGLSPTQVRQIVDEVVGQTGIEKFVHKPTHTLSFGQKKRVAIAGVLAMQPDVIILDEPTAGLDPCGVSEILKLLMTLQAEKNLSIIISTHDIDLVPLYCDYAYVLEQGRVVLSGTSEQLFNQAAELRKYALRLPRIAHLMEILQKEDHLNINTKAATISTARQCIRELVVNQ